MTIDALGQALLDAARDGDIAGIGRLLAEGVSIHTTGTVATRHLHMYGLALEVLDKRMAYDPVTGEAIPYNRNFMRPGAAPAG